MMRPAPRGCLPWPVNSDEVPPFVWGTAAWLARNIVDQQDREDVEQELVLAGWLAIGTHSEPAPLRWWVRMKMRYAMVELGKTRYRPLRWNEAGPDLSIAPGVGEGRYLEAGYERVEDDLVQVSDRAALERVLAGLPREHAHRLVEHYLRGVTLQELGDRRGVTVASEWGAMRRARRLARVEAERLGITPT